jgi:hypothetical protein
VYFTACILAGCTIFVALLIYSFIQNLLDTAKKSVTDVKEIPKVSKTYFFARKKILTNPSYSLRVQ